MHMAWWVFSVYRYTLPHILSWIRAEKLLGRPIDPQAKETRVARYARGSRVTQLSAVLLLGSRLIPFAWLYEHRLVATACPAPLVPFLSIILFRRFEECLLSTGRDDSSRNHGRAPVSNPRQMHKRCPWFIHTLIHFTLFSKRNFYNSFLNCWIQIWP